jgi:beta-lactam-binding protein with PASTA domain/tRNA A-37 threonylcarbamoyl transferase component Bud32
LRGRSTLINVENRVLADRYQIVKHLARGGMADVFEAEDLLLNRRVAIKVLHANFASDQAFVARFRREAQAAANLSHPNIVAIYDWGQEGGTYFMVMELIRGQTLRQIVKTKGPLLPRRAAEIAAETSAALSIAHQHGVYHRDIKPGNIMITEDGTVKVTDFGIARALDDSEELTRTGAVIGTATYFSPEQAQGLPADERSDIYALGIVLYEMLSGKAPFTGESPVAVAYQHVSTMPAPVREVNPEVPPEIAAVAEHAIAKDPANRYQSAEAFRDDLLRYLGGAEPIAAAAIFAGAATTMIPPPVPAAVPPPNATPTAQYDAQPEERSQTAYWAFVGALLVALGFGLWLILRLLSGDGGGNLVTIPDLEGTEAQSAFVTLQELDLKVRELDESSDQMAAGFVIRTDPVAETEVETGTFVTVVVSTGPEEFGVPNVIGENVEVARTRIKDQGFTVGLIEYSLTEDVDQDIVIRQTPTGGTTAAPDTPVDLLVSSGPFTIDVPNVSGETEDDAILELTRAGFENIETQDEFSDDVAAGIVISTNPAAGQSIPRDATLIVIVSMGPEPVAVPDLTGDTVDEARSALEDQGLNLVVSSQTVDVSASSGLVGKVADQDPDSGTTVESASDVEVFLGAIRQVTVPDVRDDTVADADAAIRAAGLLPNITDSTTTNDSALNDRIADQDPNGGATVNEGSTVNLNVFVFEEPDVTVPDFRNMTLSDAQTLATSEGLGTVSETGTIDTSELTLDGTIESQNPAAGTTVPPETNVGVVVRIFVPPPTTTSP